LGKTASGWKSARMKNIQKDSTEWFPEMEKFLGSTINCNQLWIIFEAGYKRMGPKGPFSGT
jgi:hypothetical protein